ncbi:MAG TPA: tRNA epoxyqueuosine(34) reductase QueG [Verrucomicrobiota bacterium]|nr:tRNA epoxyqueuosine(34) reductase QueG [Verrucomicrobiota bacterium]HNU50527.1 tRNA epoxyqueuosine(34) reductase QueG [Verrucomicrobiota bacterium]
MKAALQARACELGFDVCRVTSADPPASGPRFQDWLRAGHHGAMDYLQRTTATRLDPRRALDGLRSIVLLAASYHAAPTAAPDPAAAGPRGRVARYARYADYHEVLAPRLEALARFIEGLGGTGTRTCIHVDTGPLLERDLAQRGGVGFIGKHTNLVHRRLGNWLFLAEILTTLSLPPDPPEPNHCGTCSRCLAACPTGALVAPFVLDARRCLSYLTIEHKGPIPLELRPALGDRIFGCDDCLEACPWNRFARQTAAFQDHARPDLAAPGLLDLLALDDDALRDRLRGAPVLRAKRRGLRRNICVALGNVGGAESVSALADAAADPDPLVAEHARWALDRIRARRSEI